MEAEITMNESCAGTNFSLKRGDVVMVGRDIDAAEAVRWVNGGRARVTRGDLPGANSGEGRAVGLIGAPSAPREAVAEESVVSRRGKRGAIQ